MTIGLFLNEAVSKLKNSSITTARLDAEVIAAGILGVDRSWLQAHSNDELPSEQETELTEKIARRTKNEPVAYILGYKEFYGRNFVVNKDVLVPRPESETMLELLFQQIEDRRLEIGDNKLQIVDVGTGSGNLIISAALELHSILSLKSSISFLGLDISKPALKIAEKNAKKLGANIDFKEFDLTKDELSSILPPADGPQSSILLCNLPYVPDNYPINEPAKYEPKIALFSGDDGLDLYRELFKLLSQESRVKSQHTTQNNLIITESLLEQHGALQAIAVSAGFKLIQSKDLIQVFSRPSTL